MPTIKVTVPSNAWAPEEKSQVAGALTDALADVAQTSGKGDIRAYINVQIMEAAESGYAVGGTVVG